MARSVFLAGARNVIGTITHVATGENVAALTFDDGPHPEYTPELLKVLDRHEAHATFFMTGTAAVAHPELVRQTARARHAVGNHSWDHASFPLLSSRERRAQIRACAEVLGDCGARLFRPPYGEQTLVSALDARLLGYDIVMFNVATDDWCGGDARLVASQLERQVRPGCIIVLHDRLSDAVQKSYFDRSAVVEAVAVFLASLRRRFRFVTVPELLRRGRPQRAIWYKPSDVELLNRLIREDGPGRKYPQGRSPAWLVTRLIGEIR